MGTSIRWLAEDIVITITTWTLMRGIRVKDLTQIITKWDSYLLNVWAILLKTGYNRIESNLLCYEGKIWVKYFNTISIFLSVTLH